MKRFLVIPSAIVLGLAGCEDMSRPISSGSFDPLSKPGTGMNETSANNSAFRPGQFVRAVLDNTAFFKARPKGESDADKLLPRGTSMKVISASDSYVRVELDSGEVGWVPALMLEDPNAVTTPAAGFGAVNPGEYQVYPPAGGELPAVNPGEMPPAGAIPTVIDPEAPATPTPVPPVTVPDNAFPTPTPAPKPLPEPVQPD